MIPQEIEASELLIDVPATTWTMQLMSTNWPGYWILQVTQKDQSPLALLVDLENLAAICRAMRSCIDTAINPQSYPRATTMLVTAASRLPTQETNEGAVSLMADWSAEPVMIVSYYRGGRTGGSVFRQAFALDDAMRLSDMFATVYNQVPGKESWTPRMQG